MRRLSSITPSSRCCCAPAPPSRRAAARQPRRKPRHPRFRSTRCRTSSRCRPASTWARRVGVATNSKGHVFVFTRSGETRLFEFDQNGAFVKEFGVGSYGFSFAHAVRVDKDDNVWAVDEGHQRRPEVQPRRQAADGARQAPRSARAAGADAGRRPVLRRQPAVLVPPPDRHRLGSARQHLRVGRLRRLARREVRQERPLHQVGRHARQRPAAVQHAARDLGRRQRHGLRRRPRQLAASSSSTTISVRRRSTTRSARRGRCASRADRISISTAPTRSRPATISIRRRPRARSTRWSSTARCSAASARPVTGSRSSAASTRWTAATRTRVYVAGNHGVARAEDPPAPAADVNVGGKVRRPAHVDNDESDAPAPIPRRGSRAAASAVPFAQSVREINYDGNADFISAAVVCGEVAGVATNSKGHIFVYARTGHAVATLGDERTFYHGGSRLFQFDQNGKFVKEIGQGVYAVNFAQQVRVDPQDNIWIVDAGSNQVVKFDADGRYQLVLGTQAGEHHAAPRRPASRRGNSTLQPEGAAAAAGGREGGRGGDGGRGGGRGGGTPGAGINGDSFNRPSDVTWDRSGNIYVADGFGPNNRIAKFTKDGNFVNTWGTPAPVRASSRASAALPATPPATSTLPMPATTASGVQRRRRVQSRKSRASARRRRSASQADRRSISTAPTRTIPRAWTTARSTRSS